MRNVLALIIAAGAAISLAPSVLDFLQQTQAAYRFDNREMIGGAWLTLGRAIIAPIGLFAMAAVVELLFRISQRMPRPLSEGAAPKGMTTGLRWHNGLAKFFLVIAGLAYVISAWALFRFMVGGGAEGLGVPDQNQIELTFSMIFYWLTAPLEIVAWAAAIEYVSRIADALGRPSENVA
jgi:hypothetical protein